MDWWPSEEKLSLPDQSWGLGKVKTYQRNRGYWDDWWQRARTKPKGSPPALQDALATAGCSEVSLRDFTI